MTPKPIHTTLGHCHQRESVCPDTLHKWECTNLMGAGLAVEALDEVLRSVQKQLDPEEAKALTRV
jgi:hypothetical protein